jgi:hypothetical protein
MKPQTPAEGILKRNEYGDSKVYALTCQCCGSDCEHNVWVEAEETGITVTTYTKQKTNFWSMNRWQHIWRLLTRGYVEFEASIIMSEQQALNYANVLETSVADVREFSRKEKAKRKALSKAMPDIQGQP